MLLHIVRTKQRAHDSVFGMYLCKKRKIRTQSHSLAFAKKKHWKDPRGTNKTNQSWRLETGEWGPGGRRYDKKGRETSHC